MVYQHELCGFITLPPPPPYTPQCAPSAVGLPTVPVYYSILYRIGFGNFSLNVQYCSPFGDYIQYLYNLIIISTRRMLSLRHHNTTPAFSFTFFVPCAVHVGRQYSQRWALKKDSSYFLYRILSVIKWTHKILVAWMVTNVEGVLFCTTFVGTLWRNKELKTGIHARFGRFNRGGIHFDDSNFFPFCEWRLITSHDRLKYSIMCLLSIDSYWRIITV